MEIKSGSSITLETKSDSAYVDYILSGQTGVGAYLSPSYAYWLWGNSDTIGDACDRIAWAFQQITPALRDKNTGEYIVSENEHPLLKLLNNPGFRMSGDRFRYELMTSLLISGETYPIVDGNVNFEPSSLYTIGANKTSLLEGGDGWLQSIQFTKTSNTKIYDRQSIPKRNMWVYQTYDKLSETIQILTQNEKDGVRGQSPLQRVYYQAITKYYGNVHNATLMQNGSRPSGLWSPKGEPMTSTNYENLKNEIRANMIGISNSGKNLISPVPVEYKNLLLNPRDMDFIKLIENSRTEIYTQYQIPLPLVLSSTMTMSNYQNSISAFYDMSVLPRARFLYNQLGRFLLPRYKDGNRFELVIDEKEIPALKDRLFERAKKMRDVYVYSENEIRSATGYESLEEGDVIYKPATLIPVEDDDYTLDNRVIEGQEESEENPKPIEVEENDEE